MYCYAHIYTHHAAHIKPHTSHTLIHLPTYLPVNPHTYTFLHTCTHCTYTHTHTHAHTHTHTVVDCRDPGTPHNGRRSLLLTTYQSTVNYSCNSGYLLVGEQSRQCQANSKWSGVLPTCSPVDCQDPGTPANGDRMLVSTTFTATVFYSCRLGYKMVGDQRRTCQASGNWSGALPVCNGETVATVSRDA